MKQTAVEWLIEEIDEMQKIYIDLNKKGKSLKMILTATTLLKMKCIHAKEMEKKNIMQAYNDGKGAVIHIENNMSIEQYYNETYKNDKK